MKILQHGSESFIDLVHPLKEKNVKVGNTKSVRQIIMTEAPNKDECPVTAVKLYLSKLPGDCLFPKPKTNWGTDDGWYCQKEPLGKNRLNDMMRSISERANFKSLYTNHCIRSTVVTTLRQKGFSDEDCMAVTGHKSRSSVQRYDKRSSNEKLSFSEKRRISQALSDGLGVVDSSREGKSIFMRQEVSTPSGSYISNQEAHVITGPPSKSMKISADGEKNVVIITFQ